MNVRDPHAPPLATPPDQPARRRPLLLDLLFPLPALAVGVLVMRASDVPATAWGQNLVACAVGIVLCLALARPRSSPRRGEAALLAFGAVALACLAATWLDPGLEDVHRWLRLGPVRVHVGALVLPGVLATLAGLERAGRRHVSTLLALATALLLALQPDAAQATAFAAGAVVLLLPRKGADGQAWIRLVPLVALAGLSWLRKDPLAPVPHVEGIVGLAMELGTGWGALAVASLLLLPVPFFTARGEGDARAALALGAYVVVTILAPAVAHFPVPVLGQGASPIIGYFVAVGLLRRSRGAVPPAGTTSRG